jgi:hypothetical protein
VKFVTVAPPLATPPCQQFRLELARLLSSIPPCLVHRSVRCNPFFLESDKKLHRKHATVAIRFRWEFFSSIFTYSFLLMPWLGSARWIDC